MATNLELKVKCPDDALPSIRNLARNFGVRDIFEIRQTDTYFHTPSGRLKLRQITAPDGAESFELIAYQRPDERGTRWSQYQRVEIDAHMADELVQALSITLGVWKVIEKERTVGIWRRTRIHLDRVSELGSFVELETVTAGTDDATAGIEMQELARALGLEHLETIAGSYSDLLITDYGM